MKTVIILLCFFSALNAIAQITFEKGYDHDLDQRAYAVMQTSDDFYIMAGYVETTTSNWDIRLIKVNAWGDTVWTRTYPRQWTQFPNAIVEMADHSYLVAGWISTQIGPSRYSAYLLKIDAGGDTIWTKTIGPKDDNEQIFDMKSTADGGYILCGYYDELYTDTYYYLLKINAQGDSLWNIIYNPQAGDQAEGRAVVETTDKKFVIAGRVQRDGNYFAHLVKLDSTGQVDWANSWDFSDVEVLYDVKQTSDGGYVLGGYTNSFGAGQMDFYLIKTDSLGDSTWTQTYGGSSNDFGYCVEQIDESGYLMAGTTSSFGAGSNDFYLVRTDPDGDTLWTRTLGGMHPDWFQNMQVADDGGFILTGYTYSFGIGENMYLIKTDGEGLVTAISSDNPLIPQSFRLNQNYPNPFNPMTAIGYQLSAVSQVELSIYNLLGQKVATLVDQRQPAGVYQVKWDGTAYPSGVYYYRLSTDAGFDQSRKLVLLK